LTFHASQTAFLDEKTTERLIISAGKEFLNACADTECRLKRSREVKRFKINNKLIKSAELGEEGEEENEL
jgi:hypothetical protein